MSRVRICALLVIVVATCVSAAGCGFDCKVKGTDEQFANCDALQERFNAENNGNAPDNEALDDLDTCGQINGCNIKR